MTTANILFLVVLVIVVVALIIWIASISARAKRASDASDARLAVQLAELAANPPAAKSFEDETPAERSEQVIAMARDDDATPAVVVNSSKAERLAELADLHTKGSITDEELAAARAKILAE
jgi:sensor histidine kinase regulating citrate/malate metabolism